MSYTSCRVYINKVTTDGTERKRLEDLHNEVFDKLKKSKLFHSFAGYEFLPTNIAKYSHAKALIAQLNQEYGTKVTDTAFSKPSGKEYVFVNVKNLLKQPPQQGRLFLQKSPEEVKYAFKAVAAIQANLPRIKQWEKQVLTPPIFWEKLQKDLNIPKAQVDLIKQSEGNNIEEKLVSFLANYSHVVKVNTSKFGNIADKQTSQFVLNGWAYRQGYSSGENPQDRIFDRVKIADETANPWDPEYLSDKEETITQEEFEKARLATGNNTQHYANLTVPGGTNYTENEISTPSITPSIKGHAQFSTDNGIGWFRSDDKAIPETYKHKPEEAYYNPDTDEMVVHDREDTGIATKTRRILEVQSDLFQKGRNQEKLTGKKELNPRYQISKNPYGSNKEEFPYSIIDTSDGEIHDFYKSEEDAAKAMDALTDVKGEAVKENEFLQLLNKDNNWVTFFVKSIVQDSAKRGYEKVLFPSGETAAKVEGHETVEVYIRNKENRLKAVRANLEENKHLKVIEDKDERGAFYRIYDELTKTAKPGSYLSKEITEEHIRKRVENSEYEKTQLEKEIKDAREGRSKISSIANFYETTIQNILKKQGYSPNRITDEYGNTWNEVAITPEIASKPILLQKEVQEQSVASPATVEAVKELLDRINVSISQLDPKRYGGVNGIADLVNTTIHLVEGKEEKAITEETMHFVIEIVKNTNPALYKRMLNKIGAYPLYKQTFELYKEDSNYQLEDGSPDVIKIKEEAIGKVLAEVYITRAEGVQQHPELMTQAKGWWDQIVEFLKSIFNRADPFQQLIKKITRGGDIGTSRDIQGVTLATLGERLDNTRSTDTGVLQDQINKALDEENYKAAISLLYNQLEDPATFQTTVDNHLNGDKQLGEDIVQYVKHNQFFQVDNPHGDELISKIFKKNTDYNLTLNTPKEGVDVDEDNTKSYYTIDVEGKPVRIDRTTEYAKRENLKNTGGRDPFANPSPEDKANWEKKAMEGTGGHADIEAIVQSALNKDGTLKPVNEVKIPSDKYTVRSIHNKLAKFLVGTAGSPGYLYTNFPEGSKFYTEVKILNDKFSKPQNYRAGTIDLLAVTPENKAIIKDWKFMGFSLKRNSDIPKDKRTQHALQLGDYKRTLRESYGIKEAHAETVPIHVQYTLDKEKLPKMKSITIGNATIEEEEKTYLLPVGASDQSTGDTELDSAIQSLKEYYDRLTKRKVAPEDKYKKNAAVDQFSAAIRHLQVRKSFEPIATQAKTYEESIKAIIDKYKDLDTSTLSNEEINNSLGELSDALADSDVFPKMDELFIRQYGTDNLDEKDQKILSILQKASSSAREQRREILSIQGKYIEQLAKNNHISGVLSPQLEQKGIIGSFLLEWTKMPLKMVNLFGTMNVRARNQADIDSHNEIKKFESLYLEAAKGGDPYSQIADKETLTLKRKVKKELYEELKKANESRSRKFIMQHLDVEAYTKEAEEIAQRNIEAIEKANYTTDEKENERIRKHQIAKEEAKWNILSEDFDGFGDHNVNRLIRKHINEEPFLTDEYKKLRENKAALALYEYITTLNNRAFKTGYLSNGSTRFLPFIEGTILERLAKSKNYWETSKQLLKEGVINTVDEETAYGRKKNPTTGKVDRSIPKLFTRKVKEADNYSTDLAKILPTYIEALINYEVSESLENVFLAMYTVEKNKAHLEQDPHTKNVEFEAGKPREYTGNEVNASLLYRGIEDAIYGVTQDADTFVDKAVKTVVKDKDKQEKIQLATKKVFQRSNRYMQALALGLKAAVAVPNFVGSNMQAIINSGNFYTKGEYLPNLIKIITSSFTSKEGNIEKALMDLVYPLNDDISQESHKRIARKQSSLKALSAWSWQDVMMSTNKYPERAVELANALSFLKNSMVVDGRVVNIKQYLLSQPEYKGRYSDPATLKQKEREMEEKIKELKETKSLPKVASFNQDGILTIPGIDISSPEFTALRTSILEYGRKLTGQMSQDDRANYRHNILVTSFMMFKNWIPKQLEVRYLGIKYNPLLNTWEYGRTRMFLKTIQHLGFQNIAQIRDIVTATPKGIEIMREILEQKKEDYYQKTGQELDISEEEFFDLMRKQIRNQTKELAILFSLVGLVVGAKIAVPPDDEDAIHKNRFKHLAKQINKISDELWFYYSPTSAQSITRGNIIPSLSLLTKATQALEHTAQEVFAIDATDYDVEFFSPDAREDNKVLKYWFNILPVASQFQNELLPLINPEAAKELGIKVTSEARPNQ